jgi:CheY-like chemotaxis protein
MKLQILVVEDHEDSRNAISELLNRCGHDVCTAGSCQTALTLLDDIRFDVLLCDIGLPDGTGLGVVVEAKIKQALTAVAVTAYGEETDIRHGRDAGFDYYLTKPLDFPKLKTILTQIAA